MSMLVSDDVIKLKWSDDISKRYFRDDQKLIPFTVKEEREESKNGQAGQTNRVDNINVFNSGLILEYCKTQMSSKYTELYL